MFVTQDWIQKLPDLKGLKAPLGGMMLFKDAFSKNDILFGIGNIFGVGKYYNDLPGDHRQYDYNPWMGRWTGFEIFMYLEGSHTQIPKLRGGPFDPEAIKTPEERQFYEAVMGSRYNFNTSNCAGTEHCHVRNGKASKAILEFALFHPNIRKIHFVLDGLDGIDKNDHSLVPSGPPFYENEYQDYLEEIHKSSGRSYFTDAEKKMIYTKNCRYMHHELRHLHRLALLYPSQVAEKVICWLDHQQVQLPAKTNPEVWKVWEPSMEKINAGPPVRAKL